MGKIDTDLNNYNNRKGEFSVFSDLAFDEHLEKMYRSRMGEGRRGFKGTFSKGFISYWYRVKINFFK